MYMNKRDRPFEVSKSIINWKDEKGLADKSLSLNLFSTRKEACPMDLEPGQTSTREVTR